MERLLESFLVHDQEMARTAAITFTRKAAAEMQDRLAAELRRVLLLEAGAEPNPAWAASRLWQRHAGEGARETACVRARACLGRLDEATITTLHSFAGAVLRRHPRTAELAPGFQEDDGSALNLMLTREGPAVVGEVLASMPAALTRLLRQLPATRLLEPRASRPRSPSRPEPGPAAEPGIWEALAVFAARAAKAFGRRHRESGWVGFDDLLRPRPTPARGVCGGPERGATEMAAAPRG